MSRKGWWIVGGAALATAVAAVVVTVVLTTGGSASAKTTTPTEYAALWEGTHPGAKVDDTLALWPTPYQVYKDGYGNQCYEWWNKPQWLYNLCFKQGILITKSLG